MLHEVSIPDFRSERGESYPEVVLSYEVAGPPLGSAPLVLVCHALTGNSTVTGDEGWWNKLISEEGAISPTHYTILSFNIPGNAYDGREADDPEAFELRDVARLFLLGLEALGVKEVYAVIGASMGGALTWQIAYLVPTLAKHIFPIACDYRASDWLLTQTLIQKQILAHSSHPLEDARIHAMSCYPRLSRSMCASLVSVIVGVQALDSTTLRVGSSTMAMPWPAASSSRPTM